VKKLLLIFVMMATWIVVSCTTTTGNGGCFGFWKSNGPKRGTLEKNKFNKHHTDNVWMRFHHIKI